VRKAVCGACKSGLAVRKFGEYRCCCCCMLLCIDNELLDCWGMCVLTGCEAARRRPTVRCWEGSVKGSPAILLTDNESVDADDGSVELVELLVSFLLREMVPIPVVWLIRS